MKSGRAFFEKTEELPVSVLEPKELKSLRIATLNVLTLCPAEEREANGLRDSCKASETREHLSGSWHRDHCHGHVWS